MGRHLLTMNAVLVLSVILSQALGQATAECPIPVQANCTGDDYRWDLGSHAGCWLGSFCMPFGSVCPMACNTPAPSNCTAGEVVCDMGSYAGCWSGDYCMPNGTVCPPACNIPAPSQCLEGEVVCDMGSHEGCWMGDYCITAAGRENNAWLRAPSVLMFVTTRSPLRVWKEKFSATWELTTTAGMETSACQRAPPALRSVTPQLRLNVGRAR